jgi:DNA-directed RNA polymerase subunit RPC12/RpoP
MTKIEITCIECGQEFNEYSGSMDECTCTTCILKEEDPDAIKE